MVDGNRRQNEKEVGGVAIQSFANQAEKSCKVGVRAKLSPSQILPVPVASSSRTHLDARENGGGGVQPTRKGGQHRGHFGQFRNAAFPLPRPFLSRSELPPCLGGSNSKF